MMRNQQKSQLSKQLFERLLDYSNKGFTGKIDLQVSSQLKTTIYFNLGFLAWVTDESFSPRRWSRYLKQAGLLPSQIQEISNWNRKKISTEECWEYDYLVILAKKKYLNQLQVQEIISNLTQELLFDFLQKVPLPSSSNNSLPFHVTVYPKVRPSWQHSLPHTWLCGITSVQNKIEKCYKQWLDLGLKDYSPNLIPYINDHQRLSRETTAQTYQKLVTLLDGKQTLREIAARMQLDLMTIVQPLSLLIKENVITLHASQAEIPQPNISKKKEVGLNIVSIDDSPQTLKILEAFITETGHQFTGITNPMNALSAVIEKKPDLIFLDLVMPILNGYELCSKIRQVKSMNSVPIVILTGNPLNQVRAKFVGATQCLEKPIVAHKVKEIIDIYYEKKKQAVTTSPQVSSDTFPSQPQLNLAN